MCIFCVNSNSYCALFYYVLLTLPFRVENADKNGYADCENRHVNLSVTYIFCGNILYSLLMFYAVQECGCDAVQMSVIVEVSHYTRGLRKVCVRVSFTHNSPFQAFYSNVGEFTPR